MVRARCGPGTTPSSGGRDELEDMGFLFASFASWREKENCTRLDGSDHHQRRAHAKTRSREGEDAMNLRDARRRVGQLCPRLGRGNKSVENAAAQAVAAGSASDHDDRVRIW